MLVRSIHGANCRLVNYVLTLLFVTACSGSGDNGSTESSLQAGDYITTGLPATVSSATINAVLNASPETLNVTAAYNVSYFKLTYKTTNPNGSLGNASGIIAVPQKSANAASPLLSLQHGTIYLDSDAPSNENLSIAISNPAQALYLTTAQAVVAASIGYVVVAPDYLGYGESSLAVHPYMHGDSLASAVTDLIVAAQHYLADNNIGHNGQVFLGGYSEGGYATLAAQQKLQQQYANSITVTASAPGAGAYHVSQTAVEFASSTQLAAPDNIAFFMKAYNTVYGLNRLNDFFPAALADFIDSAFYGDTSRSAIVTTLPANPQDLFNSAFLQDFTGEGELELKALFAQNDIYDWSPQAPTYFFHGLDDSVVPYFNMSAARDAMTDSPVTFVDCSSLPSNHSNCFLPYLRFAIDTFGTLAEGL
jgi:pimeloyl-ACP methyl ester carboxylesterase